MLPYSRFSELLKAEDHVHQEKDSISKLVIEI
jgi:hypothetical protein